MAWGVPKLGTPVIDATGNFDLIEPAGVASGDLMVACIAMKGTAVVTPPTGWLAAATQRNTGDTDATDGIASGAMFYIVRGGSAPALTCTRTAGDVAHAVVISYSGAHATPLDTGSSATQGAAGNTPTTATFNTAEANELIVAMVAMGDQYTVSAFDAATDPTTASGATDTSNAPTAGTWRERFDANTNTGADTGLAIADAIRATAGATGTIQATVSSALGRNVMMAAAFKMAAPVISLAGTSVGTSTAASDLGVTKNLVGSSAGTSTAAADLGITKKFSGASAGVATASADLTVVDPPIELAGASAGTSTGTASLSITKNLIGSSLGGSTVGGTLLITKNFGGASAGTSSAVAAPGITKNLIASSAGVGAAGATLDVGGDGVELAGSSAGIAAASASLGITHNLSGTSGGIATVSAGLSITRNLSGTANGLGTAAASLQLVKLLQASASGAATVTADLRNTAPPTFEPPYSFVVEKVESGFYIEPAESGFAIGVAETSFDAE